MTDHQDAIPGPEGPMPPEQEDGSAGRRVGRRALLKAGLALTPIALTVKSRPAWAQTTSFCQGQGMVSGQSMLTATPETAQSCVPEEPAATET
jgi:hypothetical protein